VAGWSETTSAGTAMPAASGDSGIERDGHVHIQHSLPSLNSISTWPIIETNSRYDHRLIMMTIPGCLREYSQPLLLLMEVAI
jgi:hypothetical protein